MSIHFRREGRCYNKWISRFAQIKQSTMGNIPSWFGLPRSRGCCQSSDDVIKDKSKTLHENTPQQASPSVQLENEVSKPSSDYVDTKSGSRLGS